MFARPLRRLTGPSTRRRRRTGIALAALVVLVLAGGCRGSGTSSTATSALTKLAGMGDDAGAGVDDILRQQQELTSLGDDLFSADDLARRTALLKQSDDWVAAAVVEDIDQDVATQFAVVRGSADVIVTQVTSATDRTFLAHLKAVTQDLAVGKACELILDQVAPKEKPDDPGEGSTWVDVVQEAYNRLVSRWSGPDLKRVVDWAYYAKSVEKDGKQMADALRDDRVPIIEFATVPAVSRALVVYLRTCYSPPKLFTAGPR